MNVIPLIKNFTFICFNVFATKRAFSLASLVVMLFSACIFSTWVPPVSAKTTGPAKRQVIFLPFAVEIPGSYAYLRNGLASMLASRLASRADIAAIPQGGATEQMAKALKSGEYASFSQQLRQSGADYLVMGSLTSKGERFELTSYVFSNNSGQTPKKFQHDVAAVNDAMLAIDDLAWDISGAVFGNPKPEESATGSKQATGTVAYQTAHPERAYREGLLAGTATGLEAGGPFELVSSFRSKNLPFELMDMNAGDLDGDGKEEIVLLTSSALLLYRYDDRQFRMIATVDIPSHLRYHSVTLADLNKNGYQEIYISGSNNDNPDSSALEWNGKKISFLFEHVGWYLRTMTAPNEQPLLLGQKYLADELGGGDIHLMALDRQKGISEGKKLALPKGFNVFDVTQADIDGDGSKETIALNSNNRMQVYDAAGSLRWTSSEIYGASKNFFGTLTSPNNAANSEKETVYVRTRIVIDDLDRDGINDLLVGSNRLETVNFMPNLRYFDGSSLSAHKWRNGSMTRLWETKKIPGYITNYQIAHPDKGSNQYQIFFAEAESSYPFVFWDSPSTFLNSYSLRVNASAQ